MSGGGPAVTRGRPPKGAPRLTREAIVAAALAVIEAEGVAGVGMRSVARLLGVDAKSLYNHVDGKDGLLDAVTDHVLSTIELPAPAGLFETDLRAFARAFRSHALRHPHAAALVLTRPTASAASLRPLEAALALFAGAGFPPGQALGLLRFVMATIVGTVLREADAGPGFGTSEPGVMARRRTLLEASGLPNVAAAAPHLVAFDREATFEQSIALAIAAVVAQRPSGAQRAR